MAYQKIKPGYIEATGTTSGQVLSSDGTKTVWSSVVGYTGSAGTTGYTGSAGTIGYTGSAGSQGSIGYTGSQGTQGVIGYTGSAGSTGAIGYTGSQGDIGPIGYTGSKGDAGSIGYTGSQGNIGYTGSASTAVGYTGSQGNIGYTGSAGTATAAGADTQVQFNDGGTVTGASAGFTFNKTTNTVFISGKLGLGTAATAELDLSGNYALNIVTVSANSVDCSAGNYFTKTATGNITWTFVNVPASRAYGFVLELTNGGAYTMAWPAATKWPSATAPTLTTSGVDVLAFITDDGGTTWRGLASMINSS